MKLAAWRELKARQLNIPRLYVINDKTLLELANNFGPENLKKNKKLNDILGLYYDELLNLATELESVNDYTLEYPETNNDKTKNHTLMILLKLLLKFKALEYGVSEKIIATTSNLEDFANGKDSKLLKDWQYEIFGKYAEKLKNGELAISYDNDQIKIFKI